MNDLIMNKIKKIYLIKNMKNLKLRMIQVYRIKMNKKKDN